MILTKCAVCATDLGLSLGKKCGRCSTRYCGPECQVQHWQEGGHDQLCKQIKKEGGAEQYNANKKYAEAVAIAATACAEDTKGQTCYICLEAVYARTGEGLVRGCACGDRDGVASGRTGIAHVSCLAEEVKTLLAEALENNLDAKVKNQRFNRWHTCDLCEQRYHGVVSCALSWACWKTYLGRPEQDQIHGMAMHLLGSGLSDAGHHEDALPVMEAELAMKQRLGAPVQHMLAVQNNLANLYAELGRHEEALRVQQGVYSGCCKLRGEEHKETVRAAYNYATSLSRLQRFEEAKALMRKTVPVARRVLGESHDVTLDARFIYAQTLYVDDTATLDDLREAIMTLEDAGRIALRVFGATHPTATEIERSLRLARAALRAREGDGSDHAGGTHNG